MPLRIVILLTATAFALGCGGSRVAPGESAFESLVARQRAYASSDASADEWLALAQDFAAGNNSDDALFGAGIAYFYADAFDNAAEAFNRLLTRFPNSPHAPNALYWSAQSREADGDDARARRVYQTLVNRFPDSSVADQAWSRLTATKTETVAAPVESPVVAEPVAEIAFPTNVDALAQELGLTAQTIVIDAGHGGKDPGAVVTDRPYEKEIVLDVARRLAGELIADGFNARLTRDNDTFIPLRQRNELAGDWDADLFVSLHVNHAKNAAAHGIETWIAAPSRDEESAQVAARENMGAGSFHELADYVGELLSTEKLAESRALAQAIQGELVGATGAADRGVKEAGFVVLLGLRVPSVLVELGFLTNADEAKRLANDDYRQRLAEGVALGLHTYLRRYRATP